MGFLNRFRSPQERERREREQAERAAEQQRQAEAAERRRQEDAAAAQEAFMREVLGDDLVDMNVDTAAEAKIAIKLARVRKKELQAEKRELSSDLADHRE